jgi:hypothetical protein
MINSLSCLNLIVLLTISSLLASVVVGDINWNGQNWAMGCDFRGNDLSNVRSPGEHCSQKCAQTSRCTHFAWNNWQGGTCWMKSGSVSKSDAFSTSDRNIVCGVLSERSSGTSSKTKRKHFLVRTILNCIIKHNLIS